jgi:hypothetical protein
VGAPAVAFADDTDTGFWSRANGVVSLANNGANGLEVSGTRLALASTRPIEWSGTTDASAETQVQLSRSAAGILKIASINNTNNEDMTLDLETTANTVAFGSTTGVTDYTFDGVVAAGDGTSSLPGFSFGSQANVGLARISSNVLSVIAQGNQIARFTPYGLMVNSAATSLNPATTLQVNATAGSPGIVTLSTSELTVVDGDVLGGIYAQAPLESSGTDAILVSAAITFEADDTFAADNNDTRIVFATGASETATEKVTILGDGKVGIGIANPSSGQLHIYGSGNDVLRLQNSTADFRTLVLSGQYRIYDNQDSTYRFMIDTVGHIGINTTTPATLLDVRGAAGSPGLITLASDELTVVDGDVLGGIYAQAPLESSGTDAILVSAAIDFEASATFSASVNSTDIVFRTGESETATEKVRIAASGNVGVATTSPTKLLEVSAGAADGIFVKDKSSSGYAPSVFVQGQRSDGATHDGFAGTLALQRYSSAAATAIDVHLGRVLFGGNHTDTTEGNIAYAASIAARAEGVFNSAADMPTALVFNTGVVGTSTGSTTTGTERMRIASDGEVTIAGDLVVSGARGGGGLRYINQNDATGSGIITVGNLSPTTKRLYVTWVGITVTGDDEIMQLKLNNLSGTGYRHGCWGLKEDSATVSLFAGSGVAFIGLSAQTGYKPGNAAGETCQGHAWIDLDAATVMVQGVNTFHNNAGLLTTVSFVGEHTALTLTSVRLKTETAFDAGTLTVYEEMEA